MASKSSEKKPNILFIMTDQQYAGMMSCTGNKWLKTPALDKLAADGIRFEHAVCSNPVCAPSRVSMATGMMSCRVGVPSNAECSKARMPQPVAKNSLGLLMRKAGYATFYGGKVHMTRDLNPPAAGHDVFDRDTRDELPDNCIRFMKQAAKGSKPFFAVASFINPHDICFAHTAKIGAESKRKGKHGIAARIAADLYRKAVKLPDDDLPPLPDNYELPDREPTGVSGRANTRAVTPSGTMYKTYTDRDWRVYRWVYARLTEMVDEKIGKILDAVTKLGLEDNTVIIFTSDHGNMHANHRLASKGVFYEESVRIPFLMKYKGVIPAGQVDQSHPVNAGLDILPTCCDYAGIAAPAGLLGISQRGTAEKKAGAPTHDYVVSENGGARMLRDTRWKYTVYKSKSTPRESLVDLEKDPGEMKNLAVDPAHADTLARYRALIKEWFRKSKDQEAAQFTV